MPAHSVSSQSSAITLNGGAAMAWILRAIAVASAAKYSGRVGQVAQFVAVRIVHVRHRVEGGDFGGGEQIDRGQSGHAAAHHIVELEGAGTQDDNQRHGHTPGCAAHGIDKFDGLSGRPVVEADQHDVDAACIAREQARGVEQFLKNLVIGGEAELGGEP